MQPGTAPHGAQERRDEEGELCLHEEPAYLLGDQLPVLVLHGAILCEDVVKLTDD